MNFDMALIGFGEAAQSFALCGGWRDRATAYDRKTDPGSDLHILRKKREDYSAAGVIGSADAAEAAGSAPIVLSLVTADQALIAAREAAQGIGEASLFCDGNSVAPETKRKAAEIIEKAGGDYIDMAILAPVNPLRLSVPIALSGPRAEDGARMLREFGFDTVRVVGDAVGRASAIKMIRSVIVKGIEALTAECVLAASRAGVLAEVLSSLDASEKLKPWAERADYSLDRMLVHGLRRAAEMEEVARTLDDLGIVPAMTRGTIARQRDLGLLGDTTPVPGLEAKIDAIETHEASRGVQAA